MIISLGITIDVMRMTGAEPDRAKLAAKVHRFTLAGLSLDIGNRYVRDKSARATLQSRQALAKRLKISATETPISVQ